MDSNERDWKHLRAVHRAALERFCGRVLRECAAVIDAPGRTAHEHYLALYQLIRERDDDIADAFNDMRRSRAVLRLVEMRRLGAVTDEELEGFSPSMREMTDALLHGSG